MEEQKGLEISVLDAGIIRASGETATLRTRAHFAGQHLLTSANFARRSGEIERNNAGGSSVDPFFQDITAYVSATLLTASAALEAHINELFIDGPGSFPEVSAGNSADLWNFFWREVERKPIMEKYDLALKLKEQAGLKEDRTSPLYAPYLSANLLFNIRNALMHFKPQWDDEAKSHHQITQRLGKEPVASSPFGSSTPLFPHDFMSHDMARWAMKTAWNFIDGFSQRAGVPNKYAHMVNDLNPGYPTWPVH